MVRKCVGKVVRKRVGKILQARLRAEREAFIREHDRQEEILDLFDDAQFFAGAPQALPFAEFDLGESEPEGEEPQYLGTLAQFLGIEEGDEAFEKAVNLRSMLDDMSPRVREKHLGEICMWLRKRGHGNVVDACNLPNVIAYVAGVIEEGAGGTPFLYEQLPEEALVEPGVDDGDVESDVAYMYSCPEESEKEGGSEIHLGTPGAWVRRNWDNGPDWERKRSSRLERMQAQEREILRNRLALRARAELAALACRTEERRGSWQEYELACRMLES